MLGRFCFFPFFPRHLFLFYFLGGYPILVLKGNQPDSRCVILFGGVRLLQTRHPYEVFDLARSMGVPLLAPLERGYVSQRPQVVEWRRRLKPPDVDWIQPAWPAARLFFGARPVEAPSICWENGLLCLRVESWQSNPVLLV